MAKRPTKIDRLRELGMLNPQPERVRAPWFEVAGFFDANDLLALVAGVSVGASAQSTRQLSIACDFAKGRTSARNSR